MPTDSDSQVTNLTEWTLEKLFAEMDQRGWAMLILNDIGTGLWRTVLVANNGTEHLEGLTLPELRQALHKRLRAS